MKIKHLFLFLLFASLAFGFISCSNDDDDIIDESSIVPKSGVYILNSGKGGANNANLVCYDYESGNIVEKVFESVNGIALGDTGQDMITYDGKTYVAVSGSAIIYVLDKSGKILKSIESTKDGKNKSLEV